MGAESTSGNPETEVFLNIYDLTPINNYSHWFGFGIFHSGIEVHGKEYGFGAHDFPASGVFEVEPRSCPGFIYRSTISLGRTKLPPSEFWTFIESVASEYHGDTYHLISKNCNHFTDDMSWRLTGRRIPGWVNRLARLGALCSCLLPESLQVSTVKQLPEYREVSEDDGSESPSSTPRESIEIDDDQEKRLLSPPAGSGDAGHVTFVKEGHR
ncbi:DeSI-like protein [Trema orientale]|uniref:DeSI-like protein n=1 Tax=Trema orientale TaxID=63057 RepID=A0A2P5E8K0_TREOI|nr:DeSI-like protein [Trema orientale]